MAILPIMTATSILAIQFAVRALQPGDVVSWMGNGDVELEVAA
jgi:hypothetical protein